jgi:HEAT repeats
MKLRPLPLAVSAILLIGILLLMKPSPGLQRTSATEDRSPMNHRAAIHHPTQTNPVIPAGKESVRDIPLKRTVDETSAIEQEIDDAATQYQAASVDVIRPHLLDADPEVRSHAREAMVELGEPGAAPYLRQAAQKSSSSEEKAALIAAADLLELPSWSDTAEASEYTPDASPTTDEPASP